MPRWWSKPWHIALLPGALELRHADAVQRIACEPAGGWRAPLAALEATLAQPPGHPRKAALSVADSFARHAVAPWADGLDTPAAFDGYLRMHMEAAAGASMADWRLLHAPRRWRRPTLAIALPTALLDGLEECCARHRIAVQSLLPRMVRQLAQRRLPADALLLLPEGERCLLASRVAGAWHHVRMAQGVDTDTLAARERCLAGLPADLPAQVLEERP